MILLALLWIKAVSFGFARGIDIKIRYHGRIVIFMKNFATHMDFILVYFRCHLSGLKLDEF